MSATRTMTENRTSLHAAVVSTAARLAPGYGPPRPRHLSLLATASAPPIPSAWTDTTAKVVTVLFAARARHDALEDGADLVRRYFDGIRLTRPATLSDGVRSHLYASAGEYCNAIGWALMGARFGAEALLFAENDASRYRALTVSALGHALNGEYETARALVTEATDLFASCAWELPDTAYAVLLADALIAKAHLQIDRLDAAAATMRAVQPDDPSWDYSARAIDVMAQILRQDFKGALASSDPLVAPDHPRPCHRLMRDLLLCWRSDVFIAQGEYARALSALTPYEDSEGHGICFSGKRAAGLLHLGRERDLLDETEACVASESDHSLRTLIPVLLQRALAHHRLGARERARASTEAAMILLLRTGTSATPFIMLPHAETRDLIAALHAERPEFSEAMPCVFDALALVARPDEQGASPRVRGRLTRTELELVDRLARADAIAEIARDREVSVNTVKSQLRSIYAKLGVRGRSEAVEMLTRAPDAPSACGRTADA